MVLGSYRNGRWLRVKGNGIVFLELGIAGGFFGMDVKFLWDCWRASLVAKRVCFPFFSEIVGCVLFFLFNPPYEKTMQRAFFIFFLLHQGTSLAAMLS